MDLSCISLRLKLHPREGWWRVKSAATGLGMQGIPLPSVCHLLEPRSYRLGGRARYNSLMSVPEFVGTIPDCFVIVVVIPILILWLPPALALAFPIPSSIDGSIAVTFLPFDFSFFAGHSLLHLMA